MAHTVLWKFNRKTHNSLGKKKKKIGRIFFRPKQNIHKKNDGSRGMIKKIFNNNMAGSYKKKKMIKIYNFRAHWNPEGMNFLKHKPNKSTTLRILMRSGALPRAFLVLCQNKNRLFQLCLQPKKKKFLPTVSVHLNQIGIQDHCLWMMRLESIAILKNTWTNRRKLRNTVCCYLALERERESGKSTIFFILFV